MRFGPAVGLQVSREGGSGSCHRVQTTRLRGRAGDLIDRPRVTQVDNINQGVLVGIWLLDCCDYERAASRVVGVILCEFVRRMLARSLARLPCQHPCTADPRSLLPLMPSRAPDYLRPEAQSDVKRLITKEMKRDDQSARSEFIVVILIRSNALTK